MAEDQAAPLRIQNSPEASIPAASGEQSNNGLSSLPITSINSAVTQAEKLESKRNAQEQSEEPSAKRVKVDHAQPDVAPEPTKVDSRQTIKGVAMIKAEYLVDASKRTGGEPELSIAARDDDAAEARPRDNQDNRDNRNNRDTRDNGGGRGGKKKKKEKGQNKDRQFGSSLDALRLCNNLQNCPELSPKVCSFGEKCRCTHDLRQYLNKGKRPDLETMGGKCPVWEAYGTCHAGWKCRFVGSHSKEIEREDGRKELVLIDRDSAIHQEDDENRIGIYNLVATKDKLALAKRQFDTSRADTYALWLEEDSKLTEKLHQSSRDAQEVVQENRARYVDPPYLPSEKRRIYFGAETPVLAPLTTQGNLPYRRLCVDFGAQLTYTEMAMSLPLIQGQKSEWALMKAHQNELSPPRFAPNSIVQSYENAKDLKLGAQISASKPWHAFKAADIMGKLIPHLRVIDLNCGCPIEMIYKSGAGSALLETASKLEKMIRGMNTLSGEIPITAKIRMGVKDGKPTAPKIIERLAFGGIDSERLGPPGCAAITLHGRSRQQRYTKSADWSYIAECATLIKSYNQKKGDLTDTIREPDARTQSNGGKLYFVGNGDCYSHVDYLNHLQKAGVDSVMVARGALIKPWLFEEIEKGQYLDKSSTERLTYVEKFVKYGLEAWGSDEQGVGLTRRFLLEWLSFAHRYVPVGLLEHLPPSLQDRPPAYRGRNELENLLASPNYLDWIKISEMFLGPAHKDFKFQPKHKSNSYEIEAEG